MRQELAGLAEDVKNHGLQCTGLQTRVTKLREELLVLVSSEADQREDSVATLRSSMEAALRGERAELGKLAEAVQVRAGCSLCLRAANVACVFCYAHN
jgi:ElaB/YqjD/DUF883 family membrane-anchored ribosome-binding protein